MHGSVILCIIHTCPVWSGREKLQEQKAGKTLSQLLLMARCPLSTFLYPHKTKLPS